MTLTTQQVEGYAALLPSDLSWAAKRRSAILHFWSDTDVRAAEQDFRNGKPEALAAYDSDVETIKAAIPKDSS